MKQTASRAEVPSAQCPVDAGRKLGTGHRARGTPSSPPLQQRIRILGEVVGQRADRLGGTRQLLNQGAEVVVLLRGGSEELVRAAGGALRGGCRVAQALNHRSDIVFSRRCD